MTQRTASAPVEQRVFTPSAAFAQHARVPSMAEYHALCAQAETDPDGFWQAQARTQLSWHTPFTRGLNEAEAPFYRWFEDGSLNASYNCLDRHLGTPVAEKVAIHFEADDGSTQSITYRALHARVCRLANGLKSLGVQGGERVVIYMPMSIEAIVAMQACARLGLTHSVVFGGFSAKSLHERMIDADAVLVITADGQRRGGKTLPLLAAVEDALAMGGCAVRHVVIDRRVDLPVVLQPHYRWLTDLERDQPAECEPAWVPAEHPLFILYTSGSTGRPKGVVHSTAGYLLHAVLTMQWIFDLRADDVFWCTADVGWITGHTYVAYGPLAAGATQLVFEGVPTYPHAGRFWDMIARHRVSIFYTAPTAIRSLIKAASTDPQTHPRHYDLSSLRLLGSVGEPINPEAWIWYHTEVGGGRCPIVDTFWQTETGGHMIAPMPGATPLVPGSCTLPLPGIAAAVVDETGAELPAGTGGLLVIKRPWPSMIRTIWGDPERFARSYFPAELGGVYLAGDGAVRHPDTGYFTITGRIDDVLNVSGHRLGYMELESALVAHPLVAEAAVVSRPDAVTGEAIVAFVVLKAARPTEAAAAEALAATLRQWVAKEIGPIAKPQDIRFGDNLPKTRSGKIMRRLLRAIAAGQPLTQDVSTLENPAILEQLSESR